MKIFRQVQQIAKAVAKIDRLAAQLDAEIDTEGVSWYTAEFVTLRKEDIEKLKNKEGATDEYYIDLRRGYFSEDKYHGSLYFKTDTPSQYVKVDFAIE